MANPVDAGTFEAWITDRISFVTVRGKSPSTGVFENWLTDRLYPEDYTKEYDLLPIKKVWENTLLRM